MPGTHNVGTAGQLAVMSELVLRGYNVAIPQIDVGDDVFVVNDTTGSMWRIQVKTSQGKTQKKSAAYQFRSLESAIATPQAPELHFAFVMREGNRWRFLIMDRAVLHNYVIGNKLGTAAKEYRQISVTLRNDGKALSSGIDLSHHLENWNTWPPV